MIREADVMDKLSLNSAQALDYGSNACSGISEFKNATHGIAQGDFKNAAINSGMLGLYATPLGGASGFKTGISTASNGAMASQLAGLGAMSYNLRNSISSSD